MVFTAVQLNPFQMKIATEPTEWPRSLRRASINSFGYGGANAHAIIEPLSSFLSQPELDSWQQISPNHDRDFYPLLVSASSTKSLALRIDQVSQTIRQSDRESLRGVAFTLSKKRSHLRHKGYLIVKENMDDAYDLIESSTTQISNDQYLLPFAFVFTGQGSQYAGMAKELLHTNKIFLDTIRNLDHILQTIPVGAPDWTLERIIDDFEDTRTNIDHVTISQPICTAVQIGLVNILRSWGVKPTSVVGHSSGEIAAAYAAGLIDATKCILTAYYRGYTANLIGTIGAMAAVGMGAEAAREMIMAKGLQSRVSVACVNSPNSVTLSGPPEAMNEVLAEVKTRNVYVKELQTGGLAYHSHMMKEIGHQYQELLVPHYSGEIEHATADMFSSVEVDGQGVGKLTASTNMPEYWKNNLERPVQFVSAVTNLAKNGTFHFIEIGPHHSLRGPVKQICEKLDLNRTLTYSPTLVRGQDADLCMKRLSGTLFIHGHTELDWSNVYQFPMKGLSPATEIPPYPWDYSRGLPWTESRSVKELLQREFVRHELLGVQQLATNGIDNTWRNVLRVEEVTWLRDHRVEHRIVFPAAGYVLMIMTAMGQIIQKTNEKKGPETDRSTPSRALEFRDITIRKALALGDDGDENSAHVELHTSCSPRKLTATAVSETWFDFSISSWADGQATLHCAGGVRLIEVEEPCGAVLVQDADDYETSTMTQWYEKFAEEGLQFGQTFKSVTSLRTDRNRIRTETVATTNTRPLITESNPSGIHGYYPIHPLVLDACIQAGIMGTTAGDIGSLRTFLPVSFPLCRIWLVARNAASEATIHSRSAKTSFSTHSIDCTLRDESGRPIIDIQNAQVTLYTGRSTISESDIGNGVNLPRHPCLVAQWKPDILRLSPADHEPLDAYISSYIESHKCSSLSNADLTTAALLDLAGHKKPQMRVLELKQEPRESELKEKFSGLLTLRGLLPQYRSWNHASIHEDDSLGMIDSDDDDIGEYDLILLPDGVGAPHRYNTRIY